MSMSFLTHSLIKYPYTHQLLFLGVSLCKITRWEHHRRPPTYIRTYTHTQSIHYPLFHYFHRQSGIRCNRSFLLPLLLVLLHTSFTNQPPPPPPPAAYPVSPAGVEGVGLVRARLGMSGGAMLEKKNGWLGWPERVGR